MGRNGRLLTVAAAVSILASAASGRSLPKAEPQPKLVPCAWMGEGFARVEGSDTCIKLTGSMRVEFAHISGSGGAANPDR